MRDLIILLGYISTVPFILMRPAVGVLTWALLGLWNVHRLSFGMARSFPLAVLIGGTTLASFLMHPKDRRPLPWYPPLIILTILIVHMQITTVFAYDYAYTLPLYSKVMKIFLMTYIALWVLHTKQYLLWLVGIMTFSIGFYGVKGGVFTVLSGGQSMVQGPQGTFIDGNTTMAMALLMAIPYMVFFLAFIPKTNWKTKFMRLGLLGAVGISAFAVVGSYSRGAFLAGGAMAGFLWLKSKKKALPLVVMVVLLPLVVSFMPDKFTKRMDTIEDAADKDESAQGRIHAWIYAWNLAKDYPLTGAGFDGFHRGLWLIYAPPEGRKKFVDAHSNWFQMLGHHGYPGVLLFIALLVSVWFSCTWIIRHTKNIPELDWANRLAAMTQVSVIAYVVAGTFLGASYFDFYYYQVVIILAVRRIVEEHLNGTNVLPAVDGTATSQPEAQNNELEPLPAGALASTTATAGRTARSRLVPGALAEKRGQQGSDVPVVRDNQDRQPKPGLIGKDPVMNESNSMRPRRSDQNVVTEGADKRVLAPRKKETGVADSRPRGDDAKLSMLPTHRSSGSWVGKKR